MLKSDSSISETLLKKRGKWYSRWTFFNGAFFRLRQKLDLDSHSFEHNSEADLINQDFNPPACHLTQPSSDWLWSFSYDGNLLECLCNEGFFHKPREIRRFLRQIKLLGTDWSTFYLFIFSWFDVTIDCWWTKALKSHAKIKTPRLLLLSQSVMRFSVVNCLCNYD